MKKIILLTVLFAFGAHAETKSQACVVYAKTVQNVAIARDKNVPMIEVITLVNDSGLSVPEKEVMNKVVAVIYQAPAYTKEQAYRDSFSGCINSNAKGL